MSTSPNGLISLTGLYAVWNPGDFINVTHNSQLVGLFRISSVTPSGSRTQLTALRHNADGTRNTADITICPTNCTVSVTREQPSASVVAAATASLIWVNPNGGYNWACYSTPNCNNSCGDAFLCTESTECKSLWPTSFGTAPAKAYSCASNPSYVAPPPPSTTADRWVVTYTPPTGGSAATSCWNLSHCNNVCEPAGGFCRENSVCVTGSDSFSSTKRPAGTTTAYSCQYN